MDRNWESPLGGPGLPATCALVTPFISLSDPIPPTLSCLSVHCVRLPLHPGLCEDRALWVWFSAGSQGGQQRLSTVTTQSCLLQRPREGRNALSAALFPLHGAVATPFKALSAAAPRPFFHLFLASPARRPRLLPELKALGPSVGVAVWHPLKASSFLFFKQGGWTS